MRAKVECCLEQTDDVRKLEFAAEKSGLRVKTVAKLSDPDSHYGSKKVSR